MAYLYHSLAEEVIRNIYAGSLQDGQRITSIREMSRQREVSITTVQKCYDLLEAQGYLVSKPQSGYFIRSQTISLSKPVFADFKPHAGPISNIGLLDEISSLANDVRHIQFGTVQLSHDLLPSDMLTRSLVRATRQAAKQSMSYSSTQGELKLRSALSNHFKTDGIITAPEDLIITNGCMDALSNAIDAVSNVGDVIAVPSPCFSGQLQLLASMKRRIIEIPSTSDGIDLDQLEEVMSKADVKASLITACNQNPLGYNLSADDKQAIAQLAKKYEHPVIEDDVFGECSYFKGRPLPIKSWDTSGFVIWCGSVSKTLAAGYRIGWCVAGRYQDAIRLQLRARCLSVNTPLQLAMADFLNSGQYKRHLDRLRLTLMTQVDSLYSSIIRHFGNNCRSTKPDGGYALWIQLPQSCNALDIYYEAKKQGINIVPGQVFSSSGLYDNCFRLNAGNPWSDKLDQGVSALSSIIRGNS